MNYQQKLITRTQWKLLTEEHENYEQNREIVIKKCEEDALFFINNFLFTYNPRIEGKGQHVPFLLYDFQEEAIPVIIDHIENGKDLLIEKSRDMGASWLFLAVAYWGLRFKGWTSLMGSRNEKFVDTRGNMDSLFEKLRYMDRRLPEWLRIGFKEGTTDKSMLLINPMDKSTISGESNNVYFGTAGRYKFILFDEFSKWEQTDETAWKSCGDATPCRIANSTPSDRGMNCKFYDLIEAGIDRLTLHWIEHPDKNIGLYYELNDKKIYLNPDKDIEKAQDLRKAGVRVGSEWYDRECERRDEIEIAQELDIAYDASLAGAIFSKFDPQTQIQDIGYRSHLPLYCGIDFGMDTTSLVWIQSDGKNDYVIDEYENKGEDIYHYIEIIRSKPYKEAQYFGDPYSGGIRQMQSAATIEQILRREGIRIRLAKRDSIMDRINASRIRLKNTVVSKQCPLFRAMLENWRFRKPVRGTDKPTPEHSVFSHIGEAHGYFAVGMTMGRPNIVRSRYSTI